MADKNVSIDITAQDRTKAAFDSVKRNLGDVSGSLAGVVSGFAALAGSSLLVALAKNGINAADSLNDLSKSTNINVRDLAGLQLLARQTGTDLDGLAKGINKMSVEMGKDPEKFRALGITATDNTEALKQFADIFNTLPDINQRNALANAVFGRSWTELAPALSEGGQRIGEIIARGTELSGITQEIAEQSDMFNDKWAELTTTGAIFNRVLAPALPLLNELADSMLRAGQNTGGLATSFSPLAESLKAVMILGANVSFVFEAIGMDVARAVENVQLLAKGDFAASRQLGDAFRKDAQQRRQALDDYEKRIMGMGLTGQAGAVLPLADPAHRAAAEANANAFLGTGADTGLAKAQAKAREQELKDAEVMANLIQTAKAEQEGSIARTMQAQREYVEAEEDRVSASNLYFLERGAQEELAAAGRMENITKEVEQEELARQDAAHRNMARVMDSLTSERGLVEQAFAADSLAIIEWTQARDDELLAMKANGVIDDMEFNQRRIDNNAQHHAMMKKNDVKYQTEKLALEYNKHAALRAMEVQTWQLGADLLQALPGQSKAAALGVIAINRGLAIAQVVQSTAVAVARSFAELGPIAGIPAAAAMKTMGSIQIGLIAATGLLQAGSVGKGSAVGTFSADPSTGLPASNASNILESPQSPIVQAAPVVRRDVTLNLISDSGMVSVDWIRDTLIPGLNEAQGDGVVLKFSSSR